jgi:hypothetical protein
MKRFVIFLGIIICIAAPLNIHAAFKVYLKNGRIITGVDRVEEAETIKIYRQGIMLELSSTSVIKIEEYEVPSVEEEATESKKKAVKPPEYSTSQEVAIQDRGELQKLREPYEQVVEELKRIDELEQRSKELEREIHRKAYSPRKARMLKKEKAEIDRKLEDLRAKKGSLIKQKEELEHRLGND